VQHDEVESDHEEPGQQVPDKDKDKMKWPGEHALAYRQAGLRHPPLLQAFYSVEQMQVIQHLPRRCQEIIYFKDKTSPLEDDNSDEEVIDVGQGLNRVPTCSNAVPCILPRSILFMRRKFRLILAPEALVLQRLPKFSPQDLRAFSACELMDLAGNAFCGFNVLALLITSFCCQP
jgi:hypothetical protein